MSFSIIRMQKVKSGGVRGIENHDKRITESHTNPDIDKNKSYLNKDIHNQNDSRTYHMRIKERISQLDLKKAVRKDAVVMCEFIATSDKPFFDKLSEEDQGRFFKNSYEFIADRYGMENVVHATIHYDEKTPHLHVGIVPITKENTLSCYNIFNRTELRGLQEDYNKVMNEKGFDLEKGDSRETKRKHLDTQRFKAETMKEEIKEISAKHQNALETFEDIKLDIEPLKYKKKQLEDKIEGLEGKILTLEQVQSIQIKKVLGTNIVRGMNYDDILNLKKTAEYVREAKRSNDSLEKREKNLISEKEKLVEMKDNLKRIPMEQQIKAAKIRSENQDLKKYKEIFKKLPEDIQRQLDPVKKQSKSYDITR